MKNDIEHLSDGIETAKAYFSFVCSNMPIVKLAIGFIPTGKIEFPGYPLTTIRGAFGMQLRKLTCSTRQQDCSNCLLKDKCVFAYIFDTPILDNSKIMKKYPKAPHPFVFQMDSAVLDGVTYNHAFEVNTVLIGKGIEYLPYFIYTFMELGKAGIGKGREKYEVNSVLAYDVMNNKFELLQTENSTVKISKPPMYNLKEYERKEIFNSEAKNVTLELITPLRIKYDGRMVNELEFHHVIRNFTRRLSLLSYFHCGIMPEFNVRRIIAAAKKVRSLKSSIKRVSYTRYSGRQKQHMEMGGIKGKITFESVPGPFLGLMKLCELLGVGKNTSFGMGQVKVNF